jgi:LPXTG-site transpeptidase (sortase) family protein
MNPDLRSLWPIGLILCLVALGSPACQVEIATGPIPAVAQAQAPTPAPAEASAPSTTTIEAVQTTLPADESSAFVEAQAPTDTSLPAEAAPSVVPAQSPPDHITAPAINLDAPVVAMGWKLKKAKDGSTISVWDIPSNAAGWHLNSALPGHGSNVVLSGHHNIEGEVFRYVVDLKPGDAVTLHADGRDYTYIVTDRFILPERGMPEEQRRQNAQWIKPTSTERLTLVTCWPYTDNSHRVIVVARPAWQPTSPEPTAH